MTEANPVTADHVVAGLSAIADRYDGFILDLWGTVHNGVEPLPGALDCLRRPGATRQDRADPVERAPGAPAR